MHNLPCSDATDLQEQEPVCGFRQGRPRTCSSARRCRHPPRRTASNPDALKASVIDISAARLIFDNIVAYGDFLARGAGAILERK